MAGLFAEGPAQSCRMVGLGGLEPPTSPLSGARSNHLSYRPGRKPTNCDAPDGGASRDRTDDPLLAKQVLSQLSYGPIFDGSNLGLLPEFEHGEVKPSLPSPPASRRAIPGPQLRRNGRYQGTIKPRYRFAAARSASCLGSQVSCVGVWRTMPPISKGGDPAAPSDTATLLRLHPSH